MVVRKQRRGGDRHAKLFYVGSKEIANRTSSWPVTTEAEAIERARTECSKTGQPQIVVKIVAMVEQAPKPVVVKRM